MSNTEPVPFSELAKTLPVEYGDITTVDVSAPAGSSGWVPLAAVGEVQTRLDRCDEERKGFLSKLSFIKRMLMRDKSIPEDFDSRYPS
jgi:hypothetical protein